VAGDEFVGVPVADHGGDRRDRGHGQGGGDPDETVSRGGSPAAILGSPWAGSEARRVTGYRPRVTAGWDGLDHRAPDPQHCEVVDAGAAGHGVSPPW
jgi:hypothetical protein